MCFYLYDCKFESNYIFGGMIVLPPPPLKFQYWKLIYIAATLTVSSSDMLYIYAATLAVSSSDMLYIYSSSSRSRLDSLMTRTGEEKNLPKLWRGFIKWYVYRRMQLNNNDELTESKRTNWNNIYFILKDLKFLHGRTIVFKP